MRSWLLTVLALLLAAPAPMLAQHQARQWEVFELALTARERYENPYAMLPAAAREGLLRVEFRGVDGAARGRTLTVFGFWDGGQRWRVRFAPPETGTWEFRSSSADAGLNGARGRLRVRGWSEEERAGNPTRRGFVRVRSEEPNPGRFFQYADGTPFLWIGDTWWNWTHRRIEPATFRRLVDDRAAKGFTLGQLFVAANGWGAPSSLLDPTFTTLDVAHMQRVDSMIAYANSRGITVWVMGWWSRERLDETAGEEKMKRWARYLVHRLGAYNVVWVGGGEYNMHDYGGLGLAFWKELGRLIKEEDPYDRIVGMHPTPPGWEGGAAAPQWSTAEVIHEERWLDYNQSQVGHGRWRNEMIPRVVADAYRREPAKPVVVTEPWYEFVEGNPTGRDVRFGAWSALLSGAAGHSYGGGHVWLAHVPEAPSGGGPWPLEREFARNTLDYEGAVSMGRMASFFRDVAWWTMAPHPALVHEYPDPYCLARPGDEYVLYLRWGGSVKVDLRPSTPDALFEFAWVNPATGERREPRTVPGGEIRFFQAPEDYPGALHFRDWVLHIRKRR